MANPRPSSKSVELDNEVTAFGGEAEEIYGVSFDLEFFRKPDGFPATILNNPDVGMSLAGLSVFDKGRSVAGDTSRIEYGVAVQEADLGVSAGCMNPFNVKAATGIGFVDRLEQVLFEGFFVSSSSLSSLRKMSSSLFLMSLSIFWSCPSSLSYRLVRSMYLPVLFLKLVFLLILFLGRVLCALRFLTTLDAAFARGLGGVGGLEAGTGLGGVDDLGVGLLGPNSLRRLLSLFLS